MKIRIPKVADFEVTGGGDASAWDAAEWLAMPRVAGNATYTSRAKVVYSEQGIYFLVDNEDKRLTCTDLKDFENLFQEDVVEIFLWPDVRHTVYFEYEISPLGKELPILVPQVDGMFYGWLPWHYSDARCTRRAARVRGGAQIPGATVDGWSVEVFLPFALLRGLGNTPPKAGSTWRANIYRIDYDTDKPSSWAWTAETGTDFHMFQKFGTFVFE